ncbi:MAG: oligosaccharide flippase family protein, partial [Alistipes sp.]|nr:oligosaccharide flippase family protein [Alistipes sp.]
FNILSSVSLYLLLTLISPYVARYYDWQLLAQVAPVLFLLLPLNALCVIQNTIMVREFRFAQLSTITFISSLVSGIIAIVMALTGFGIWSLVGQRVSMMTTKAALLWWRNPWRPTKEKAGSLREMAPYSLRLMTTDLITALYNNVAQLFIGKIYSGTQLGYFNQAQKLKDMPVNSTMQSIQSVTFPALAKIGGDEKKFSESYRSVVMVTAYIMFPMMAGLIATAEEIYTLLLKPDWHPAIPYFRVLCIVGFFYPIAAISYNILKVKSNGSIILRLEIIKKVIMTLVLCLTIPHSVMAVAWGLAVMAASEMCLNIVAARRYAEVSIMRLAGTLLPIVITTSIMYLAVHLAGQLLQDWSILARLSAMIATGIATYILIGWFTRQEAFCQVLNIAKKILHRNK